MTRTFTPDWLARTPAATALLDRGFDDAAARAAAVATARRRVHPAVIEAIETPHPAQATNRQRLADGAVVVVTGQQAGLFGGPLYTIHKVAAAIRNAAALEAETGVPCVPVFWLQDEDHDFDEIASCTLLNRAGDLATLTLDGDPALDGVSVAARPVGPGIHKVLEEAAAALDGLSDSDAVVALLNRCWHPEATLSTAFSTWLQALFGPHGLLLVDPAHPALVAAARPLHDRAIAEASAISTTLRARSDALQSAGFTVQVHVRPDAPLSFVHPDGPDGPRVRFEPRGDGFVEVGTDRIVDPSSHCTTSALLRPLLQDTLLPTAAYVGGPGEIAYFAQLPPLYAHFGLAMPLIVPRARFRVHDETADRLLAQLEVDADALAAPRPDLLAQLGRARDGHPDPDALREALVAPVTAALADFAPHATAVGLDKAADKTRDHWAGVADKLVDRYRRALARDDDVTVARLDRALARLHPGGPQERVHAWPWYGARYGVGAFVDAVLGATMPFHPTLEELRP